jgi:hypothetical protein
LYQAKNREAALAEPDPPGVTALSSRVGDQLEG